ncbi:type I-D CRISPR-associated helicase Cas3 [Mastigocoleus testarum BC008]|uniref:Type I-D CRISPR-associated helicase Cas3 n=1 Tax=Mastigocoleus testarum BC008 TaxID=371196 RepID=A0A0V7ZQF3_9CYAN|nr:type I-D CRISPR-associated helicase Cas3 [Mastigocoleus testarum BC008]
MKLQIQPLYSQLNPGLGNCPLGCKHQCQVYQKAPNLKPPVGSTCPLSSHQAQTCAEVMHGDADIIFNTSATGDGKSLGANLPTLLDDNFRIMGLYPTIELVEDQAEQQKGYHQLFGLDPTLRVDRIYGADLSRRVKQAEESNKFQELLLAIQQKPVLLTNPDIFHYITHYQYRDSAYGNDLLPLILAEWPDLWVFDEFHIFGSHQETAALNSMTLIRRTQEHTSRPRRFLFTSATPKPDFITQLQQTGFKIATVEGVYTNQAAPGYRQILQAVELEFVILKDTDTSQWLEEIVPQIRKILDREKRGRGLIIVNSVAKAGLITHQLEELLPNVIVREVSGRVDRQERKQTKEELKNSEQPVLVVGTSAVDVGVDFRIHLLIFESSDSATVIQRLGRLGRHSGFSLYKAFILIPGYTPWVMSRLQEKLETLVDSQDSRNSHSSQNSQDSQKTIDRSQLNDVIKDAFDSPKEFEEYRKRWGGLQAQGMLWRMSRENAKVSKSIRDRITEDLQNICSQNLESLSKQWYGMGNSDIGKATQEELLRFRGSSTLQAGVWDRSYRFYTYDLLKLLPYAFVEVTDRDTFLEAASNANHGEEEFPKNYIRVYFQIEGWVDKRFDLTLHCNRKSNELKYCQLILIDKLSLVGHPQSEVINCLQKQKILAFLVPVAKKPSNSHWDVSKTLRLSPLFGLYRLTDADEQAYACAFNQDALLLEACKWRLKKFTRNRFESSIF